MGAAVPLIRSRASSRLATILLIPATAITLLGLKIFAGPIECFLKVKSFSFFMKAKMNSTYSNVSLALALLLLL